MEESNESEKLDYNKTYPIAGYTDLTGSEMDAFGFGAKVKEGVFRLDEARRACRKGEIRAAPTAEFRPPKKGEWYLSGAVIEAYRAESDFLPESPYRIARLVRIEKTVTERIVQVI